MDVIGVNVGGDDVIGVGEVGMGGDFSVFC